MLQETNLEKFQIETVLLEIADLSWKWQKTDYDLVGLDLTEMLMEVGHKRAPKGSGQL